ncbi:hypothetical protein [Streptomyces sp. uw30]|uniref:hypothetical protein n=1 Tax=Streptomyces sp. uw30 TaxID=1828179 RepID=UPI002905C541|nr:hypothetical protein [Streptomyces sp. uw30]
MNEQTVARHWLAAALPKAAPALATTTVLALARIWNANGAEHSVGNAVLMTALSLGAAAAGVVAANATGDSLLTGTAFAASGALAFAGVAGYSDGLPLPLLLWSLATAGAYGLAHRPPRDGRVRAADERAARGVRPRRARRNPPRHYGNRGGPHRRRLRRTARAGARHPRRPARLRPHRPGSRGTAQTARGVSSGTSLGRDFWLRKAAVLDRIALEDVGDDAAEMANEAAERLMSLDDAGAICDPRHYVRQQYAHWITNK